MKKNKTFCLFLHWFLTQTFQYQNWKANMTLAGNNSNEKTVLFHVFLYAQQLDQKLGSLSIYFVYLHTTIWRKYMVLFHLFFLLCTTIWQKHVVLFRLFFILCTTIQPKLEVLVDLFRLFAHDQSTKTYGPLLLIPFFVHDHSTKN